MARTRPNPPVIHMIVAIVAVPAPPCWRWPGSSASRTPRSRRSTRPPSSPRPRRRSSRSRSRASCPRAGSAPAPAGRPWASRSSGAYAAGNTAGLGYLSPDRVYVAVDQSDAAPEVLISDVTRRGRPDGTSSLGERTWTRYVSDDGRTRALALISDGRVTIVSADTGYPAIEAFATTLTWSGQAG